ncbi:MAG: FAD-dependent oxidoreductase [Planctomycetia bacterium]|nr:FAD-dependent oxidoreductase [Planctomycetia bacterium]
MAIPHFLVVGAGIVGAACVRELARAGNRVTVIDSGPGAGLQGGTAAGMGHVVVNEGDTDTLKLCLRGRELWRSDAPPMSERDSYWETGTLWIAEDEETLLQLEGAQKKLESVGVVAERIDGRQLIKLEPALAPDLAGGLRVPHDGVIYAPTAAREFLNASPKVTCHYGVSVKNIGDGIVELTDGRNFEGEAVIVATGISVLSILGEAGARLAEKASLYPREGHLAITARGTRILDHHIVEAGYQKAAHSTSQAGSKAGSVACAILPRQTDQLCLGSSRRPGEPGPVDPNMMMRVIARCERFVPSVKTLPILRTWTGARAATSDGKPLLGPVPGLQRTWIAAGFEGLGITQAPAAAELIRQRIMGESCTLDPWPWDPARPYKDSSALTKQENDHA